VYEASLLGTEAFNPRKFLQAGDIKIEWASLLSCGIFVFTSYEDYIKQCCSLQNKHRIGQEVQSMKVFVYEQELHQPQLKPP
jgi:hypothetical protein